ncbi:MAG: transposase family protein, partial [Candidatus Sulfotelmatobacter sp.]
EREVRDLPCFEYRTTVVIELYRVRCPDCGIKAEKVALLPSKADRHFSLWPPCLGLGGVAGADSWSMGVRSSAL